MVKEMMLTEIMMRKMVKLVTMCPRVRLKLKVFLTQINVKLLLVRIQ